MPLLNQRVNTIIGSALLTAFALGAAFLVLQVADEESAIAKAMLARTTLPD